MSIAPSATVAINNLAKEKKRLGIPIVNFAAGDPILPVHPSVERGIMAGLQRHSLPYPPVEGLLELCRQAVRWLNRKHGCSFELDNAMVTCGGKFAIFAALQALLDEGDEVIIPAPYWVSYPSMVQLFGGVAVIVETTAEMHWKISPEQLKAHFSSRTKALIFNNPCNPTGVYYTAKEVSALMAFAKEHGILVIADEVYSDLIYEPVSFASCGAIENPDNGLVIQSCSKNFGMAGSRVGFAFGPSELIKKMITLQSQSTTGTSLISQWAALGALENADEVNAYVKKAMRKRRDLFVQTFNALFPKPVTAPPAAIYAWVSMDHFGCKGKDSVAFCREVLEKAHVAIVPGAAFGKEGYVRFAFSEKEEDIVKGLQNISRLK